MTQAEFNLHKLRIKLEGYTIIPGLLTPDECAGGRAELEARYPDRDTGAFELLFNKARIFERLYQLPDLLKVIRHFTGADAVLSAMYGSAVQPGEGGRGLHADGAITGHNRAESAAPADGGCRVTSHTMAINLIFCFSEFTAINGATEFVPGSHRYEGMDMPEEAYQMARTAVADEGSVIVFDINVWHGTTKNQTDIPRYAVLSPWRRRWTLAEYNMPRLVNSDVLERAGEDGPVIFGVQAQAPYTELWQWDRATGRPKSESEN